MAAVLPLVLVGCSCDRRGDVVKESYIHKYGVPISKEDFKLNGADGAVVQLLRDGVTVTKNYVEGKLSGKTTYTFPNSSTIARTEVYEKGVLISNTENYLSGVAKMGAEYQDQKLSKMMRWYEDGTPSLEENYENGLLVSGEYRTLLNSIESRVEQGMGIRLMRSSDGKLISKDTIRAGQMVERITYFENGDPSSITPYENDQIHGTKLTFLPGGIPNSVENWIRGKQEGLSVYYLNGEKVSEMVYRDGVKEGTELRYRDSGSVAEEVCWKKDKQHGPRKMIVDGKEVKTEWYHEGELVSRPTFERMNPPGRS